MKTAINKQSSEFYVHHKSLEFFYNNTRNHPFYIDSEWIDEYLILYFGVHQSDKYTFGNISISLNPITHPSYTFIEENDDYIISYKNLSKTQEWFINLFKEIKNNHYQFIQNYLIGHLNDEDEFNQYFIDYFKYNDTDVTQTLTKCKRTLLKEKITSTYIS